MIWWYVCCFAPSLFDPHLPHTLQCHSGSWGRWSCLEQISIAKICFIHLHESPIGPKMLSRSREAKRGTCDYLCRGSVSLRRHKVWQWNQIHRWLYIISMVLFSYLFCQYAETLLTKLHRVLYHFWLCTWCILFVYERIFLKTFSN